MTKNTQLVQFGQDVCTRVAVGETCMAMVIEERTYNMSRAKKTTCGGCKLIDELGGAAGETA